MNYAMPVTPGRLALARKAAQVTDPAPSELPYLAERTQYGSPKRPVVFAASIGIHLVALGALMIVWRNVQPEKPARPTSMAVELLPLPSAPPVPPEEAAPGPEQVEAQEPPKPIVEKKQVLPVPPIRMPTATVAVAERPQPEPDPVRPTQPKRVEQTTAPAPSPLPPKEVAAAPALGTPTVSDQAAQQTWEGKVLAKLERLKRYPKESQSAGDQDRIMVTIRVDRAGNVITSSILRSRGLSALDAEVMALVRRCSPFPAPPASLRDADLTFVVPVEFSVARPRSRRR